MRTIILNRDKIYKPTGHTPGKHTPKPIEKTMNEVSITELANYSHDQQIESVTGTLSALWEPRGDSPKFDPQQGGYLKDQDGNEHRICFASTAVHQPMEMKGKTIRLKSKKGGRGYTGVKMRIEKDGEYRKIWVTATAIIEVLENGQPSDRTTARPAPARQAERKAESPAKEVARDAGNIPPDYTIPPKSNHPSDARWGETVRERVYDYYKILSVVYKGYEATKESLNLPEIPEEGMRQIATHISMGYKGQYGVYASPEFGSHDPAKAGPGAGKPQLTESKEDAPAKTIPKAEPPSEERPKAWRDFIHPKSGDSLGVIHDENRNLFDKLLAWSFTATPGEQGAKVMQGQMLLAAAELKLTALDALESKISSAFAPGGIHPQAPDELANRDFGVEWNLLTHEDASKMLRDPEPVIKDLTKIHDRLSEGGEEDIPA